MPPGEWSKRPHEGARRDWTRTPRYAPADLLTLLWRERVLMGVVFVAVLVLGLAAAYALKPSYTASSSVLVRLGQEYVYEPRAGDAGRGAVPNPDQVIQAESEILGSAPLKERVIRRLGLARIAPALARKYEAAGGEDDRRRVMAQAVRIMDHSLKIQTSPEAPIIRVTYAHDDPKAAAQVLNTLLEEYLIYRRGVLADLGAPALADQKAALEGRLAGADAAYRAFLDANRIGDFAAEKAALTQVQAQVEQQKYQTQVQLADRQARLGALSGQLARVAPEVGLYRDVTTGSDKLVQMKTQREDMLSRYRPDAQPVRDLDAQIARMEGAVAAGRTSGDTARRYGANPVFQTVQTEQIQTGAEVAALRRTEAALARQLDELTARQLRLAELEPQFDALSLDRDVLQANVRDFAAKAEQGRSAEELAARGSDSIRIVARAEPPLQGKSLRKPVAILALLFAGFSALCAGLARMFLRPGLPLPRTAGRTLDLPVMGSAPLKSW